MADPNVNESAYGSLIDSYASKYGIPSTVFRDVIGYASGFDPMYKDDTGGKGISGLNIDVAGVDPFNIGDSLDFAGKVLKSYYNEAGDWEKAASEYLGIEGIVKNREESIEPIKEEVKNGILDSIKDWLRYNAYGAIFIIVGLLMIIATIWAVIKNSSVTSK